MPIKPEWNPHFRVIFMLPYNFFCQIEITYSAFPVIKKLNETKSSLTGSFWPRVYSLRMRMWHWKHFYKQQTALSCSADLPIRFFFFFLVTNFKNYMSGQKKKLLKYCLSSVSIVRGFLILCFNLYGVRYSICIVLHLKGKYIIAKDVI